MSAGDVNLQALDAIQDRLSNEAAPMAAALACPATKWRRAFSRPR